MKLSAISCIALASSAILIAPATASDVTYSTTAGPIAAGGTATVNLPQFDGSLGVLRVVRVSVFAEVSGTWSVENLNAFAAAFGGYGSGTYVGATVPVSLPTGFMYAPNPAYVPDPAVPLAAFDGVVDYGGASGTVLTFSGASGDGSPGQFADIFTEAQLLYFLGAGNFSVGLGPILETGPLMPSGFQTATTRTVDAWVNVRYTYDPLPTRICRAAPSSPCPCGNFSAAMNGCGNSINAAGGALDLAGSASLSADTLVLNGTGMTNSNAMYFQGTTFGYVQTIYGDGLRCVAGTVVRLGTKTNAGGASQYPSVGDLPVSVRGAVGAPGTRFYQVIYRDGGNFCTPSQFNATNGLAIEWAP
jgi:hypothetical protein